MKVLGTLLAISVLANIFIFSGYKRIRDNPIYVTDTITQIDTFTENIYKTKIKWRTRNEKEVIYIYVSSDTMQPIIRTRLRERYANR